ncbi:MAG TPA: hypothetical protein VGM56_28730 [Byssovorax sp.]
MAAAFAAAAMAGACGGGDTTATTAGAGASGTTSTSTGAGGAPGVPCDGQPAALSLGGVWAARGVLDITLQGKPGGAVTTCPADQHGSSSLLLLLSFEADPSDATKLSSVTATLCSLDLPTVTALVGPCSDHPTNLLTAQLVAPQAFLDALPGIATQPVTGTLTGTSPGADVALDRFTVVVGSDQGGAMLPSWQAGAPGCDTTDVGRQMLCEPTCVDDCASLRDDDVDGYPGVTVNICGYTESDMQNGAKCQATSPSTPGSILQGQGFIDIQVDPQFTGAAVSSCEIDGTVDTDVIYQLVGANVYLASSPISVSAAIGSLPDFQVLPATSKFRMTRIDGQFGAPSFGVDTADVLAACQTIIAHQNEL